MSDARFISFKNKSQMFLKTCALLSYGFLNLSKFLMHEVCSQKKELYLRSTESTLNYFLLNVSAVNHFSKHHY